MRAKTYGIEITFAAGVDLPLGFQHKLTDLITSVTKKYEREHPGRIMWPAGIGDKPSADYTSFDASVLSIDVAEREDYSWPCKKCLHSLGNHKGYITYPPAGDCDYEPTETRALNYMGFRERMFANHRAKIARKRRFASKFKRRRFRYR